MVVLLRNLKLILGAVFVVIIWYSGYKYGVFSVESKQLVITKKHEHVQNTLTAKLQKQQQLLDKKTSVKVRTIYVQEDATGCIDTAIPNGVFEALYSGSIGPELN